MSRQRSRPYPLDPLAVEAQAPTIETLANRIGVSRRTVHRWARDGVPSGQADRIAVAIGSHPAYIWPDHWNRTT